LAGLLEEIANPDDARMAKPGLCLCLLEESLTETGIGLQVSGHDLDGHLPAQYSVPSAPHFAHTAFTDFFFE
jgi:hypothetical protein